MGHSKGSVKGIMKFLITVAALFAIAECRRHLCDDGTRPICSDGSKAVYNRPTGKNTDGSKYFPPPVCNGEGAPACADGSTPKVRFNTCSNDEKKCPTGQGQGAMDKAAERCVARDNLTALGGRRTGTNTTVSESSTLEILDLATRDTTGDPTLLETRLKDIIMLSFRIRLWYLLANVSCQRARNIIGK